MSSRSACLNLLQPANKYEGGSAVLDRSDTGKFTPGVFANVMGLAWIPGKPIIGGIAKSDGRILGAINISWIGGVSDRRAQTVRPLYLQINRLD